MRRSKYALIAALIISGSGLLAQLAPAAEIDLASVGQMDGIQVSGLGQELSDGNLGELTGRQEININQLDMQLSSSEQIAQANGNSILNSVVTNGANSINGNSFANSSGLVTVIQNSGNQVLIQNDLIMNLTVK